MVIVTQNQYILASKIHHITMDEQQNHNEVRTTNGRYRTVVDKYFQITVIYSPELTQQQINNNNGRDPEQRECSVVIRGNVKAHLVFKNLIQQIREQMPDQLYLDTALERMLAGIDMESLKEKDEDDIDDFDFDAKPKKKVKLNNGKVSRLNNKNLNTMAKRYAIAKKKKVKKRK